MIEIIRNVFLSVLGMLDSFFIAAATTVFLQSFYDSGIRWTRKKAGLLGIYVIADAAVQFFSPESPIISAIMFLVFVIIPVYDCKRKRVIRALRVLVSYLVIMWTVSSAFTFGLIYLMPGFDHTAEEYTPSQMVVFNIVCISLLGFMFYYIKNLLVKKNIFIRFGKRESLVIAAYSLFVFFMLVMAVLSKEETDAAHFVISVFAAVCFVFMVSFPLFYFSGRLSQHYRHANELHESYMQSQLEHFRQYKAAQEETARFRHDIRNNLGCISDLLASGREQEAREYLAGLLREVRSLSPEYVSGDEILDCIISSKASEMKRNGIDFTLDGVIPGGLGWAAIDVCNVFANALDNAMESCMNLSDGQRYVSVSIKTSEQFRYIRIVNPVSGNVDTDRLFNESGGYTSKKRTSGHGIGTYSIRRTAEKYGGVVNAECSDGTFTLELIVNKSTAL